MARADVFAAAPWEARVAFRRGGSVAELVARVDPCADAGREVRVEGRDLAFSVLVEPAEHGALLVRSRVTARRDGIELDAIEPLALVERTGLAEELRFLRNGWQGWSATSAMAGDARDPAPPMAFLREIVAAPGAPTDASHGHLWSDLFTAVARRGTARRLVLGWVRSASQFGGFELDARSGLGPRLVARLPFDGVPLAAGETRVGEPLLVLRGEDTGAMLDAWARRLALEMRVVLPSHRTVGWCSWYEYFTRIDERIVRANLDAAVALRPGLDLGLFEVDDGWQAAIGDWTDTNAGFPHGIVGLGAGIAARGFAPGIWLAPFLARPESQVATAHPGWFVRDGAGRPRRGVFNPAWGLLRSAGVLDVTHPAVADHLARTCELLVGEAGFRFLKLDFLFAAALPGRRHDPRLTGAEVLRRGLDVIRRAVGEEVHLLGCGCPLGPAVGLVDSMRIGADVAPFWRDALSRGPGRDREFPSTRNAIRNAIARSFLHMRLWRNDPDCLLVRDRRTRLDRDEVISLASIVVASGGSLIVSDALADLAGDRLDIARRAIEWQRELADEPPSCPDLLDADFPRMLVARRREGGALVAVLNPEDEPRDVAVALADLGPVAAALAPGAVLADLWSGFPCRVAGGRLHLGMLPAHGARLVRVPPPDAGAPAAAGN